jgi:protein-disulfide isomerase
MKHSKNDRLIARVAPSLRTIAAMAILALAPACERLPDSSIEPGAAIRPEAPAGKAAAQAAVVAQAEPSECGAPRENCGCEEGAKMAASPIGDKVEDVAIGSSPARGPKDAPVTVVVFADYECPFCSKAEQTMAELDADYPGKLRFVFKNNPLPFHKNAKLAAKAALAAAEQGKFWEYHDALFANIKTMDPASLDQRAQDLGLDIAKFRRAMESQALDAAVTADVAEAQRLDIKGTPTFFVNGRRVIGAQPIQVLRAAVDKALDS